METFKKYVYHYYAPFMESNTQSKLQEYELMMVAICKDTEI